MKPLKPVLLTENEESLVNLEIRFMLRKGAIQMMEDSQNQVLGPKVLMKRKVS